MRPWAVPTLKLYMRTTRLEGTEHIPKDGPAIIASNHLSGLDHLVLPAMTKRVIYNISKIEHFQKPIKRWFFENWGVIPLDRGKGDTTALEKAKEVLRRGDLFCIYPEGTRSRDGKLHKGHTGVARLALELDVPVIPVAMIGTFEAKPPGSKGIDRSGTTAGVAGPPMRWPELVGKHNDREACRKVTDEVMHAIAGLSGQEYVHEYHYNEAYARKMKAKAEAERG